ncbi:hypothetical protein NLX83_22435 [Allokutzneria sp. A3M-2-11 16]|uniref:hypothetical protein n=1 Tax=Allokutzneria sp. A3M-2-11 16 TaxID=2962043 RepID=UPI0020B766F0|nr:hypothetical protein [Allokutzneria sp. A3M-2-11 16]MCP3802028.1 hypothetical protein [Allokutzneria sp. A3M-2-11 16]
MHFYRYVILLRPLVFEGKQIGTALITGKVEFDAMLAMHGSVSSGAGVRLISRRTMHHAPRPQSAGEAGAVRPPSG